MPDIFYLISKWWKQMLAVVMLSLVVVATILYLRPVKYLAVTTALPASSYAADKASIFNNNIQALYPAMGSPDDLDVILGTAQLDTVYITIAEQFELAGHYKIKEQGEAAKLKAASLLKGNTKVIKGDYSELKVKVWDGDKAIAPQLANAITGKLQAIHQDLQNSNNISLVKSLQAGKQKIQVQIDSINNFLQAVDITREGAELYTNRRTGLAAQLQQYEKLIGEYQLIADNKPPVLIIVEKARLANWPDKPKWLLALTVTFVLSLLFSVLLILLLERKKSTQK
jgi:capsular polysaccharide biosynthesis protein